MVFIPPYDHTYVIAGQGTVGKEMIEDLQSSGVRLDYLFVCVGGGGLISGICLAANALSPNTMIIGVEPEAGNDVQQSFRQGERVKIPTPVTIADGAQTPMVGAITFELIKALVDDIHTVSDTQLIEVMRFYAERMKMIVEPTGCLSLAAALQARDNLKGQRMGVIISGGNIDLARFAQLLAL
jgi:threonine dehydratase